MTNKCKRGREGIHFHLPQPHRKQRKTLSRVFQIFLATNIFEEWTHKKRKMFHSKCKSWNLRVNRMQSVDASITIALHQYPNIGQRQCELSPLRDQRQWRWHINEFWRSLRPVQCTEYMRNAKCFNLEQIYNWEIDANESSGIRSNGFGFYLFFLLLHIKSSIKLEN